MHSLSDISSNGRVLERGELLWALRSFRRGDFSVRLPLDLTGLDGEIAQAFNDAVEMNASFAAEFARVSTQVGEEGRISQRLAVAGASGSWASSVESINTLIEYVVHPVREVARVIGSVARGDLSQTMML